MNTNIYILAAILYVADLHQQVKVTDQCLSGFICQEVNAVLSSQRHEILYGKCTEHKVSDHQGYSCSVE